MCNYVWNCTGIVRKGAFFSHQLFPMPVQLRAGGLAAPKTKQGREGKERSRTCMQYVPLFSDGCPKNLNLSP
jgi:hypothetical protein